MCGAGKASEVILIKKKMKRGKPTFEAHYYRIEGESPRIRKLEGINKKREASKPIFLRKEE